MTGCEPRSRDPDGRLLAVPLVVAPVRAEDPPEEPDTRDEEGADDDVLEPPREEADPDLLADELGVREPDEGCARCGSASREGLDGRMLMGSGADEPPEDPEDPDDPAEPDPAAGRGIA